MYSLIVIDMQEHFLEDQINRQETIDNCKLLINKAIDDNAHIMFVEYYSYNKTVKDLTDIVDNVGYKNISFVVKGSDDGGREINKKIIESSLPKNVKFCGINTEYCVYASVRGYLYAAKKAKIEVMTSACGSKYSHENGLAKLNDLASENKRLKIS